MMDYEEELDSIKTQSLIVTPSGQKCSSVTLSLCCLSTTRRAHAVPKLRLEGNTRQLVVTISCAWQYFAISSAVQSRSRLPTKKTTRSIRLALLTFTGFGAGFSPRTLRLFCTSDHSYGFFREVEVAPFSRGRGGPRAAAYVVVILRARVASW